MANKQNHFISQLLLVHELTFGSVAVPSWFLKGKGPQSICETEKTNSFVFFINYKVSLAHYSLKSNNCKPVHFNHQICRLRIHYAAAVPGVTMQPWQHWKVKGKDKCSQAIWYDHKGLAKRLFIATWRLWSWQNLSCSKCFNIPTPRFN